MLPASSVPSTFPQAAGAGDQELTLAGASLDWAALQPALQAALGPEAYETWGTVIQPLGWQPGLLTLGAPSIFMAQKIRQQVLPHLEEVLSAATGAPVDIQLQVAPQFAMPTAASAPAQTPAAAAVGKPFEGLPGFASMRAAAPAPQENPADRWQTGTPLDPRYTFTSFVTGKSNTFAFTAAQSVAETLARGDVPGFNPFFLHGGVGLGKTHLMQAVGHHVLAARPGTQAMYLSAEQFMHKFIRALKEKDAYGFKELFRGVDLLLIDDIQFITGKDNTQEEFFHTFNHLLVQGKQIILTADRPPHELVLEERLKSRLGSGLTVEVHAPEEETRLAILQTKAETMAVSVPAEVLGLLATHIASNVRELEGALNRLVAFHRLTGAPISEALAREQLRDLFKAYTRIITIEDIQQRVAAHFNIRLADMHSPRRAREVARPRQVAMYLAKQLTQRSYPDIGRAFGGRDHTTVMHACQQIDNLLPRDPLLAEHVALLHKALTGRTA